MWKEDRIYRLIDSLLGGFRFPAAAFKVTPNLKLEQAADFEELQRDP